MRSKIDAAKIASLGGVPVFVGKVASPGDLLAALHGDGHGTYFEAHGASLPRKKQWLGFFSTPIGTLTVDAGAEEALIRGGRSLLPVGVKEASGQFHTGDVVEVISAGGEVLGRGIVNYDAEQLHSILGLPSTEVFKKLDSVHRLEVIHRDEWISLKA